MPGSGATCSRYATDQDQRVPDSLTTKALIRRDTWDLAGGGAHEAHNRGHIKDAIERSDEITKDGDLDMVLPFRTQESERPYAM
jgi:hypothetical protein